ncbi:MAG: hypothetical protein VB087_03540 [Candidatus Limiplasma sp.]|nr:hypothetical protein [Candidatus Limiplasma sp.]MEA5144823.1 hypothetical protein [Candidatus Limiplasma sp.]
MELLQQGKPFYRGNLHCHTTKSDGAWSPEQVIQTYQELGYDFLAITDHRRVTVPACRMVGSMLVLPGIELDYTLPEEVVHIVGFGMVENILPYLNYELGPQNGVNAIRACGGRAIIAHPHWSLNTMATLMGIHGASAAEVYNTVSYMRPDSSNILDVTAAHGKLYPMVASDDSHAYAGEQGVSFTMVQAETLTSEAIKAAMDQGLFYASQGPGFRRIAIEDGQLVVETSPVSTVYFQSNLAWTPGRIVRGEKITHASYPLNLAQGERFVRCQVIDAQGKSAWCSPIAL